MQNSSSIEGLERAIQTKPNNDDNASVYSGIMYASPREQINQTSTMPIRYKTPMQKFY